MNKAPAIPGLLIDHFLVLTMGTRDLFLCLLLVIAMARGQLYMYTPGDPLPMKDLYDAYGVPTYCSSMTGAEQLVEGISCSSSTNQTPDACESTPAGVSHTPVISALNRVNELAYFSINCGRTSVPEANFTYTLDGTLPDIFNTVPQTDTDSRGALLVIMGAEVNITNQTILAVRCIEPGKLPSRLSYMKVIESRDAPECDNYDRDINYRELDLPVCDPSIVGTENCDGQTIVAHPEPPSPPSEPPQPTPPVDTTPAIGSDPCQELSDAYDACASTEAGGLSGAERAEALCPCNLDVLGNDELCGSAGYCRKSGENTICSRVESNIGIGEKTFDVTCEVPVPIAGTSVVGMGLATWIVAVMVL